MSRRVLFYVQHLLGIGHLARAGRIAAALADAGLSTTVVTGGMPVPGFPGPSVDHVSLPPITAADEGFSGLVDAEGRPVDAIFEARRRTLLIDTFRETAPDILIIEAFPFGRRQMRFELLPLLDAAAAATPRPLIATSVRDILQERTKPGRNEESAALVARYFDRVLVHGDPRFVRIEETFPLAGGFAEKIVYTGLVSAPRPAPSPERFDIVVSAGGGAAGRDLVAAAVDASRLLDPALSWCLVTGPNLAQAEFDAALARAPGNLSVHRFRRDFGALLAAAGLSVSQAGYNTVCDVLQAGCRSVLVPFASGGETEQTVRAERLAARGLAHVVPEEGLTGAVLAKAIEGALAGAPPATADLRLDGARQTASLLQNLAQRRR
ncbi:MAG: glycosyl transferase [Rhizobiales bacterium]|nr:glycosyl transferase [Hyphomicrobiales bacterium]